MMAMKFSINDINTFLQLKVKPKNYCFLKIFFIFSYYIYINTVTFIWGKLIGGNLNQQYTGWARSSAR